MVAIVSVLNHPELMMGDDAAMGAMSGQRRVMVMMIVFVRGEGVRGMQRDDDGREESAEM